MSEALYASVGGRLIVQGDANSASSEEYWNFGWVPREDRTEEQEEACERMLASLPKFSIDGASRDDVKKVDLTALWKHPTVVAALGFPYEGTHQLTGSCVGAAAGNVVASLNFIEVLKLGDPEKIILPFYPYHYGRGRLKSGMGGRGEGSTGTGQAEALRDDGVLDNLSHPELPRPENSDGLIWGKSVEMEWSAGNRSPSTDWLAMGKKYPVKTIAKLNSANEVRQALVNLYPVTCASMYGHNPYVKDGVLMGRKGPRWGHQMSLLAFWDHPSLGPIFYLMNQWGKNVHGVCPTGIAPGGVWITEADVDWICRDEVFAFSGMQGYPAADWNVPWVFSTSA